MENILEGFSRSLLQEQAKKIVEQLNKITPLICTFNKCPEEEKAEFSSGVYIVNQNRYFIVTVHHGVCKEKFAIFFGDIFREDIIKQVWPSDRICYGPTIPHQEDIALIELNKKLSDAYAPITLNELGYNVTKDAFGKSYVYLVGHPCELTRNNRVTIINTWCKKELFPFYCRALELKVADESEDFFYLPYETPYEDKVDEKLSLSESPRGMSGGGLWCIPFTKNEIYIMGKMLLGLQVSITKENKLRVVKISKLKKLLDAAGI